MVKQDCVSVRACVCVFVCMCVIRGGGIGRIPHGNIGSAVCTGSEAQKCVHVHACVCEMECL